MSHQRGESLSDIQNDLGDCTRCGLCEGRNHIVFGVGNPKAKLVFVGEGPGYNEDEQGIPFVGRAGKLLDKMIEAIDLKREDVYIANVVKCRPPQNRKPTPDEVLTCYPFLLRQILAIRPQVIVALGATAADALLLGLPEQSLSAKRGRIFQFAGAKLIVTYHPAFLLRSPGNKRDAWEDLKVARSLLGETNARNL